MVAEMLERGALIAVSAARDPRDITDRPFARPDVRAAKLTIPSGKGPAEPARIPTDPPRLGVDSPPRDAVAAALASAVTAAVAKVGRQRGETAATPPHNAPPPAPSRSPVDPVSAATVRETAPAPARLSPPSRPATPTGPTPIAAPTPLAAPATPAAANPALKPHATPALPPTEPPRTAIVKPAPPPPSQALPDSPEFGDDPPTDEVDSEMSMFEDYDRAREGGDFISEQQLLDRVELIDVVPLAVRRPPPPPPEDAESKQEIFIEMEDAENATQSELASAVSLNFAGPKLADDEAERKLEVINEVFVALVAALDSGRGVGMGQSRVQLLIEGTPGAFASLFKGVEVDAQGRLPVETVMRNLRRRPASEHRRLLNRGLSDVIERALSLASEELDEQHLERLLERIAGYQQRLGM
jgi:hypothetical protein